jgi:hypothetical protein
MAGRLKRLVLAALLLAAAGHGAAAGPQIEWRIENPFRFFEDPADTEVHRATFAALTPGERRSPVLNAERALGSRDPEGWAQTMLGKSCWDARLNRHACAGTRDYIHPRSHMVVAGLSDLEDADALGCTWLTAPRGRGLRGIAKTQRCDESIRLDIPYPGGAEVSVEIGGLRVAAADVRPIDLLVVGMGDSFASGEGNPDVAVRFSRERSADYGKPTADSDLTGYPARVGGWSQIGDSEFIAHNPRWLDQACHRSLYSHQLRAALQLAIEDPHRAVTFVGVACSGAEITQGLFLRYKGNEWVPNPPELSQISSVAQAQCGGHEAPLHGLPEAYHMSGQVPDLKGHLELRKCDIERARKIDLLLVAIGGNDVGFTRLVANAVLTDQSILKRLGGWMGHIHGATEAGPQLRTLAYRYKALKRAFHYILHMPWDQPDRVLLTAYPGLAFLEDGRRVCRDGQAGMDVLSSYFFLSSRKTGESTSVAEQLNETMRAAAREHGWSFVDSHRRAFLGRGVCAGWSEHALTIADDLRLPRRSASGEWVPYNPADYPPYAPRQRWFRTPNDAFMTAHFHVAGSVAQNVLRSQSLSWFQLMLAATYSGAFHPTAEGQAAIADAVADRARAVLARYGQGRERAD